MQSTFLNLCIAISGAETLGFLFIVAFFFGYFGPQLEVLRAYCAQGSFLMVLGNNNGVLGIEPMLDTAGPVYLYYLLGLTLGHFYNSPLEVGKVSRDQATLIL